jgi:hypothetical protein
MPKSKAVPKEQKVPAKEKIATREDIIAVLKEVLEKFPEDKYAKSEMGWVLYDKELKPAKEESDLGKTLHFANEIVRDCLISTTCASKPP